MNAGKQVQHQAVEQVDKYKALLGDAHARHKQAIARIKQLELCRYSQE